MAGVMHLSESERRDRPGAGSGYDEFLRVPSLSAGTYVVPAGGVDDQQPHQEDEVYVVLAGAGRFTGGGETVDVRVGSVLFVPACEEHRFHDVTADLEVLVVFGPAETAVPTDPDQLGRRTATRALLHEATNRFRGHLW